MIRIALLFVLSLIAATTAFAQGKPPVENDFYKLISFDIQKEIMLEAGGIELLPNGSLAICTRRGEVWMVDKPFAEPRSLRNVL